MWLFVTNQAIKNVEARGKGLIDKGFRGFKVGVDY